MLRRSVRRGWTESPVCSSWHPDVLLSSQVFMALRWTMLKKVIGVDVARRWLYLATKPPHIGVDADGLSCSLHRASACGCRPRVQSS
jgi:hypothetical protein